MSIKVNTQKLFDSLKKYAIENELLPFEASWNYIQEEMGEVIDDLKLKLNQMDFKILMATFTSHQLALFVKCIINQNNYLIDELVETFSPTIDTKNKEYFTQVLLSNISLTNTENPSFETSLGRVVQMSNFDSDSDDEIPDLQQDDIPPLMREDNEPLEEAD